MAEKLIKRGSTWYFRFTDADGVRHMRKGCTDRRATEQMAATATIEADRIRGGLADPKEIAYRDHECSPLSDHLDAWTGSLEAKGDSPKHSELFSSRARRVVVLLMGAKLAEIEAPRNAKRADVANAESSLTKRLESSRLSDLSAERVQKALATLKLEGRSLATCNHHRAAVKAFSKWCFDSHRTREDALRGVTGFNAKEDRRHDRRTVSVDELRTLIEVAEIGPVVMQVPGAVRALCYRLAVSTGLRFSEIRSIEPESFDWTAPTVTVPACYTKNGQTATFPIPDDLASDLADFVASIAPHAPVFPLPKGKGAKMLRVDLEAAGIPYRDESGLVFDFHALRCETATLADAAGVTPRVVQKMMRHSSLELTGRYTRPRVVDIEAAASMLPNLKPVENKPESLAATGTDSTFKQTLAPSCIQIGDFLDRDLSGTDAIAGSVAPVLANPKTISPRGLDARDRQSSPTVASDRGGARTLDQRIKSPLLYRLSYPVSQ